MRATTARTKRWFEARGCLVGHVEKWIPARAGRGGFRVDLFSTVKRTAGGLLVLDEDENRIRLAGFDQVVIGYKPWSALFVQSTTGSNHAAHRASMVQNPNVLRILNEGLGVALVSWAKRGERGKRKVWTPRIELFEPTDCGGIE